MTVLPLIPAPAYLGCALADHAFLALRREYLDNPACPDNGIWNFLGTNGFVWGPQRPETCFNLAAMAVSLAVFGIKNSDLTALDQSRTKYARALFMTRNELCTEPVDPTDELLMTCLLLSAYEVSQATFFWCCDCESNTFDRTELAMLTLLSCSQRASDTKMGSRPC